MDTLKTVTIYVLLAVVFIGGLWMTHLRMTEVEKERCQVWAWEVCQKLNTPTTKTQ